MKGRKPVPTQLKVIRGNPGKRRLNVTEMPTAARVGSVPSAPDWLDSIARREWHRLAKQLARRGLLTTLDKSAFAAYCAELSKYVQASELIKAHGTLLVSKQTKTLYPNPACAIASSSLKQLRQLLPELGLTPSSRSRIPMQEESGADPIAERFFGKLG